MMFTHRCVGRYRAVGLQLSICLVLVTASLTTAAANDRNVVLLNGQDLTLDEIVLIAAGEADISIAPDGMTRIKAAHQVIQHYVDNKIPAYGINTMYGQDFGVTLPQSEIKRINRINLIQEATKVGDGSQAYIETSVVRATWALLVNSYAKGFSGASPELAEELVRRVNTNELPAEIEDGGSMGDADLSMNAALAVALYAKPGFEVGAGEATNLLTYNFINISRAALAVKRFEELFARSKVSLALAMEGYRANPSPISESASKSATLASKRKIQAEMRHLLNGSRLWEKDGPRRLQDFLSLRTSADQLAAVETSLRRIETTLAAYINALQVSPMIDTDAGTILSVTEYDTTQLTLDLDHFRQALGLMAIANNARTLKAISRPFTDLPSGFSSKDPKLFDGLYTRNLTYWANSLTREVMQNSQPVTHMTISFMAEGDEDYSVPFPNSVMMTERLVDRLEKIVTMEALVGSVALMRRVESGELKNDDVPESLRDVYQQIVQRSPLKIDADTTYTLAPLLDYFINVYEPPEEIGDILLSDSCIVR
jgi:histidine ammonia-lyase